MEASGNSLEPSRPSPRRRRLAPEAYIEGVLNGERMILARAITVIESELESDGELAAEILQGVLPDAGDSLRVGITGVPGAGKSTFIDALGLHIVRDLGQKVAVLSVDPSSPVSGRQHPRRQDSHGAPVRGRARLYPAFSGPRASRRASHGATRETIVLCEAAGYHNILVETVGVGQSETAVRSMTDFFLLLMISGAGDELQGIKRGILEMIDAMAINKADGDNKLRAERARVEYATALHLFPPSLDGWVPASCHLFRARR